jgi:hypothetical protein
MQQPADFFRKEILTEHHRLEDPISSPRVLQQHRHDVEIVASVSTCRDREEIPTAQTRRRDRRQCLDLSGPRGNFFTLQALK